MKARVALSSGLFLLVTACLAPSGPAPGPAPGATSIVVSGDYVHPPSGFVFPESFAKFERSGVSRFDAEGNDIGVGYNLVTDSFPVVVTIYVFPPPKLPSGERASLAQLFDAERAAIAQFHPGAGSGATWTPPQTQNEEPLPGHAVILRYAEQFAGERQTLESLLYLFEYDGWMIKYRISYPAAHSETGNLISQVFVSSFKWKGENTPR